VTANGRFAGRTVLVTGAGSGIGRAAARRFAAEGARVVALDRDGDALAATVEGAAGEHRALAADLADPGGCDAAVAAAAAHGRGRLDVLVNAAGILLRHPLLEHPLADWRRTLDVNLKAPFRLSRAAIRLMRAAGSGAIVNVCSFESLRPLPGHAAYTASKGALWMLTRATAYEVAPYGVRVNAVAPGVTRTAMNADLRADPAAAAPVLARHPMGRFGEPDEVAAAIAWLASDDAAFVTGALLAVDGGLSTH
jgi:NAD(P)-dependent dehydrogenase (short-subunit alcohol dehydrogenase family)